MSSYEDRVANAIADRLEEIEGLNQSAYMLSNPIAPVAEVMSGVVEFDEAFGPGATNRYEAVVRVTVGTSINEAAQILLREYRSPNGPKSIKRVLEEDRQLGGLTADLNVNRISPFRNFRRPDGVTTLGCDFELEYEGGGLEE